MRIPTLFLSLLLFSQVCPASGQDPQVPSDDTAGDLSRAADAALSSQADSSGDDPDDLSSRPAGLGFEQLDFGTVREGYLTLRWSELTGAAEYRIADDQGVVMYRGAVPIAFISGLSDGQYSFGVQAFNAEGEPIATGTNLATATVQHWPLSQALLLMGIGFLVFVAVVFVIVRGAWYSSSLRGDVLETMSGQKPASLVEEDTA